MTQNRSGYPAITRVMMILAAAALLFTGALAENATELMTADDGWEYIGYVYGGITFAVPGDYTSFGVSESDAAKGCVIIGGNEDFTLQVRGFDPDVMKYEDFKAIIRQESSAEWSERMDGDLTILTYRNTRPSAVSELYGIVMTGLDGRLYKISIFTGADDAFGEDAPVWAIAEMIGKTARHQDFSEWGLESPGAPKTE